MAQLSATALQGRARMKGARRPAGRGMMFRPSSGDAGSGRKSKHLRRENAMHAVVRSYSGPGAKDFFKLLAARRSEIESIIRGVQGFVAYTLIETADGGLSVTVCRDKAGTDESVTRAREWVQANASATGIGQPSVSEGNVILQMS
jgi:hypothetical protein